MNVSLCITACKSHFLILDDNVMHFPLQERSERLFYGAICQAILPPYNVVIKTLRPAVRSYCIVCPKINSDP